MILWLVSFGIVCRRRTARRVSSSMGYISFFSIRAETVYFARWLQFGVSIATRNITGPCPLTYDPPVEFWGAFPNQFTNKLNLLQLVISILFFSKMVPFVNS